MSNALLVRNRQRAQPVNSRLLQKVMRTVLLEWLRLDSFNLAFYIVGTREITHLNETFLRHQGSTDVLAFDYAPERHTGLIGEIFVCMDEAKLQATRFRTTWQSELVRYMIHGLLHLKGYDDHQTTRRRIMKREENRLLRQVVQSYDLSAL